jgi:hypothetical protein
MEFDGLCPGYPKMTAYVVTNLGRYIFNPKMFVLYLNFCYLSQARQRKKRAINLSSIVNVRCNPADVIFTTQLLKPDQYAAI